MKGKESRDARISNIGGACPWAPMSCFVFSNNTSPWADSSGYTPRINGPIGGTAIPIGGHGALRHQTQVAHIRPGSPRPAASPPDRSAVLALFVTTAPSHEAMGVYNGCVFVGNQSIDFRRIRDFFLFKRGGGYLIPLFFYFL